MGVPTDVTMTPVHLQWVSLSWTQDMQIFQKGNEELRLGAVGQTWMSAEADCIEMEGIGKTEKGRKKYLK